MSGIADPDHRDPLDVVTAAILEALPPRVAMPDVLEVGAGPGVFATRFHAAYSHVAYLATDSSPRLVDLARDAGVPARLMDVQELLAPDDAYDVVVAMWMLSHVPDLDRGLAEITRVLRPGGRLVAVTNGDGHLADLRRESGGAGLSTSFGCENGEAALRRHFADVRRDDVSTREVLPDRDAALAYLRSSAEDVAWDPPTDGWPREYAGHVTVFVATAGRGFETQPSVGEEVAQRPSRSPRRTSAQ